MTWLHMEFVLIFITSPSLGKRAKVYPSQAEIRNWARMNYIWHTSARAATGGKVALFQENSSGSEIFSLQIWTSLIPL